MSTDEPDREGPTVARQLGRLRGLAVGAGLGAMASIAGCSAEPGGGTSSTDDGGDTPTPGPDTPSPTAEPTPATTPTPTALSTAECRQRTSELESELASVRQELERLETEVPELDRRRTNLEQIAALFDPPSDEVIAEAKAVGTAAREAVVFLEFPSSAGTGWYVDDHHIITNAHNVFDHHGGGERTATAWTLAGESYETTTIDYVSSLLPDIAVIRTDEQAPASLPAGTNPAEDSSAPLVQVGHPGGIGNWMITLGHLRRYQEIQSEDGTMVTELLTTVPGRSGVSGSPVLNLDGEVVGLTYAGSPVQNKQPDEPPLVAESTVYDRAIASLSWGGHIPIDTVMTYYQEWT